MPIPTDVTPAFLVISGLVRQYDGVRAVDYVSLAVNKGEIFALLGSSGSGKSTLLRMLAGFEAPDAGSITLAGRDIVPLPPYERPISMMFQSYALFPHLTVWDNVAFGLRREGMPKGQVAARVEQMLALVQLGSYGKRKPHQLSGGQQQRVALARSLAKRPQLLLLDEPLGALDKKLREQTQVELVNIIEQVGVTCMMVTHDQDEAMSMANRIAVMNEGRILQVGTPRDIYDTPNCRFVAGFIGSINLFEGDAGAVAVRPEKIVLRTDEHLPADANAVHGVISAVSYFGNATQYQVLLDSGMLLKAARFNDARLERGQRVLATWDSADARVLTA
ncbi:MAG: ABC transporter ATP-binding protein [Pseudomonadota bacterium]|nr:ABC transporter ATP-binding protein [Pseudomonadota bacterium]